MAEGEASVVRVHFLALHHAHHHAARETGVTHARRQFRDLAHLHERGTEATLHLVRLHLAALDPPATPAHHRRLAEEVDATPALQHGNGASVVHVRLRVAARGLRRMILAPPRAHRRAVVATAARLHHERRGPCLPVAGTLAR